MATVVPETVPSADGKPFRRFERRETILPESLREGTGGVEGFADASSKDIHGPAGRSSAVRRRMGEILPTPILRQEQDPVQGFDGQLVRLLGQSAGTVGQKGDEEERQRIEEEIRQDQETVAGSYSAAFTARSCPRFDRER